MLRIAIQSKGRLNEESLALLRDDDIPHVVSSGTATLGIVGLNEMEEQDSGASILCRLGFGACRLSLHLWHPARSRRRWLKG